MPKLLWMARTGFGPAARSGHAMIYDSARKRVVLVGGASVDTPVGDTWEWDGQHWTQVADIGPSARTDLSLAYDSVRRRTVLFGGAAADGVPLGDTWEWDGENWTQLAESGPSPRSGHALAYDSVRRRLVLFGGTTADGQLLGDTWEFDGADWTEVEDTGPVGRAHHTLVFSPSGRQVVLFGGGPSAAADLDDTWTWDGRAWQQIADFGPPARRSAAAIAAADQVVLFGGAIVRADGPPAFLRDTWGFDGRHWTQLQDIGPTARSAHAMAFDEDREKGVLFGGRGRTTHGLGVFGDTWEHAAVRRPVRPPDPGPGQMMIESIVLSPTTVAAGQEVSLTIHLALVFHSLSVIVVHVPQQALDDFSAQGGSASDLFLSGELLTAINIPPSTQRFTTTFVAPASPGPHGVLAGTRHELFAFTTLVVTA